MHSYLSFKCDPSITRLSGQVSNSYFVGYKFVKEIHNIYLEDKLEFKEDKNNFIEVPSLVKI